jgi:hypothetical protein
MIRRFWWLKGRYRGMALQKVIRRKKKRGDCSPLPLSHETLRVPSVLPFYRGHHPAATSPAQSIRGLRCAAPQSVAALQDHATPTRISPRSASPRCPMVPCLPKLFQLSFPGVARQAFARRAARFQLAGIALAPPFVTLLRESVNRTTAKFRCGNLGNVEISGPRKTRPDKF